MSATKGVILAAGMGERLAASLPEPKPLLPVAGCPLILRTIRSFAAAGVSDIGVVIGFRGAEVREATLRYTRDEPVQITFIDNVRWQEPNGISLHEARRFTGPDEFILGMVDHVFDPEIIRRLRDIPRRAGVTLAVDREVERVFDLEDATKVLLDDELLIRSIGKQIPSYNAIDCGLFRCSTEVFPALEDAFAAGRFSISAGMERLASRSLFWGLPVEGLFWQDVDTPQMWAEAERRL